VTLNRSNLQQGGLHAGVVDEIDKSFPGREVAERLRSEIEDVVLAVEGAGEIFIDRFEAFLHAKGLGASARLGAADRGCAMPAVRYRLTPGFAAGLGVHRA
jgi:hypothetical protein